MNETVLIVAIFCLTQIIVTIFGKKVGK